MSPDRTPRVDVHSSEVRGIVGGILAVANAAEKQSYEDMLNIGVPIDTAAQIIGERIEARMKMFTA